MLLQSKSPICKFGLGGDNHNGDFNKPLYFVNASIQLSEDFSNVASTFKGKEPMVTPRRIILPQDQMKEKSTQTPRKDKMMMQAQREWKSQDKPL